MVDGTWDDNSPSAPILDARLTYVGNGEDDLDFDLYGDTEEGGFLAWRPRAGAPWVQYPDYDWQAGSLANGTGVFKVSRLRKGQYAFAKGDVSVAVVEPYQDEKGLMAFPNPSHSVVGLRAPGLWSLEELAHCRMTVTNASGQLHWSQKGWTQSLDVAQWARGTYTLEVVTPAGKRTTQKLMVQGRRP